eukprot:2267755-Rhodomonas_salina.1
MRFLVLYFGPSTWIEGAHVTALGSQPLRSRRAANHTPGQYCTFRSTTPCVSIPHSVAPYASRRRVGHSLMKIDASRRTINHIRRMIDNRRRKIAYSLKKTAHSRTSKIASQRRTIDDSRRTIKLSRRMISYWAPCITIPCVITPYSVATDAISVPGTPYKARRPIATAYALSVPRIKEADSTIRYVSTGHRHRQIAPHAHHTRCQYRKSSSA